MKKHRLSAEVAPAPRFVEEAVLSLALAPFLCRARVLETLCCRQSQAPSLGATALSRGQVSRRFFGGGV